MDGDFDDGLVTKDGAFIRQPVTAATGSPVTARTLDGSLPSAGSVGGPYTCKASTCTGKTYFGILTAAGDSIPACPNCKTATSPVKARS